ncbi:MAG TPA: VCBS repeat-containing protein, partial [Flavisolibacter sp.]|nr:VCBS repeat-containing protein [Flavisolibacter sp.]
MYFYNGAGIGAGDFNKDGLVDLFFSSNQEQNKLYLNKGGLKFTDVTAGAQIPQDSGWSTGVSVVDINNDGLLDIYVCKVGNYESLRGKNQLLVCQGVNSKGVPFYADKALDYGLAFSGFSTQAAFFDYDMDGDLDCFLLNHSVHQNGSFAARKNFLGTYHPLSGDRIYRNDGARFTDVTKETGINSSAISYGLGLAVADINMDGYPDMYVGNDFHENDYLYINQRNGTFSDKGTERMMHTSQFSMGVDVADINNDAQPEAISMDMLPSDPYILKRSLGEDEFNIFNLKLGYGYNHQYTRNNLQWNRGNEMFTEVGLYAGVAATDWSWAPLWMDFDNDGLKDLFISNGIPRRLNDIDYVNFVTNSEIQEKIRNNDLAEKDMELINQFPQIKLRNKFFRNSSRLSFEDLETGIVNDKETYSNGAVYADLDNDGDLDVVVNNIDDPVLVYENKASGKKSDRYLSLKLTGPKTNINAVGAKAILFADSGIRIYEKYPVRGFQSSMEIPMHIGLKNTAADSMIIIWPDNTFQKLDKKSDSVLSVTYQEGLPRFDYDQLKPRLENATRQMVDMTDEVQLSYRHEENSFVEFDREPLMPFMVSREGPALAVGDIDGDGRDDVFMGASRAKKSGVFLQQANGQFIRSLQPDIDNDSTYEMVDACLVDVNGDKKTDLVVASGGNEYYGEDKHQLPLLYLNDGKGQFKKLADAFHQIYLTASCITPDDYNKDGAVDLFIGARTVPWEYGEIPSSYLLQNDGSGHFKNVTGAIAKDLSQVGFVKSASWINLDKDDDDDLVLSLEWGGITAFINEKGVFKKKVLTDKKGWWNFTLPFDVDGDGDLDLIAGNQGLNGRINPSPAEPVRLYYNDFDDNGKKEQVVTYYLSGKEIPFANKDELQKQIPIIRKKFLYAADFAKSGLKEIFTGEKLKSASLLSADYFASSVLINDGN